MQAIARAGVEFHGSAMRYAEIEEVNREFRLLRLGDCQFEFDAFEVLFKKGPDAFLDTISEAITEVFQGSAAKDFRIAIHPPVAKTFLSSVPSTASPSLRDEQLIFESAVLDIDRDVSALRSNELAAQSTAESVDTGDAHRRVHVSHVATDVSAKLEKVFTRAGWPDFEIISSSEAVAKLTRRLAEVQPDKNAPLMSVGIFADHSVYTIVKNGEWLYDHVRPENDPTDVAYFAMQAMAAAGISVTDLSMISHYGSEDLYSASGTLNSVFKVPVQVMNPIETVGLRGNAFEKDFAQTAFTVCIGSAF